MAETTFADRILAYHLSLRPNLKIPAEVDWLFPYEAATVQQTMHSFFKKYFSDNHQRIALFGINPGRFGAGITGTPFTDPIRLESVCGIKNDFKKRQELSSVFVYDFIEALGGADMFYTLFYITSICPLGFVKDGKNYNYYDSKELTSAVLPLIEDNIEKHLSIGISREVAFSMGMGKNFKFLNDLNKSRNYFDEVVALPHPRWVMQYRLKRKNEFVQEYVEALSRYL